jgi:glycosyltransferase involved in cell wall biosynthesis
MYGEFKKGLVSVVIPTYNQVQFIDDTLGSIVAQSYKDLEIIVSDDCSQDGTIDKILNWSKLDSRILPLISTENVGLSKNVNKGLDMAKGEFIAMMGGDDKMAPSKIEKQVEFLTKHADYSVVLHWVEIFDGKSGNQLNVIKSNILHSPTDWFSPFNYFGQRKNGNSTFPPTAYLARSSYALHSRYDSRLKFKNEILFAIDNYMNNKAAKWHCIPEVLGYYRLHENNMHKSVDMNNALLEETYVNSAIASARYPSLAGGMKNVVIHFLLNNLFYLYLDESSSQDSAIKDTKARLRAEAGLLRYWYSIFAIKARLFFRKIRNK